MAGYLRVYHPHWLDIWSVEHSSHSATQSGYGNTRLGQFCNHFSQFNAVDITSYLFDTLVILPSRYTIDVISTHVSALNYQLWSYRLLFCIGWEGSESVGSNTVHAFLHHVRHAMSAGNNIWQSITAPSNAYNGPSYSTQWQLVRMVINSLSYVKTIFPTSSLLYRFLFPHDPVLTAGERGPGVWRPHHGL